MSLAYTVSLTRANVLNTMENLTIFLIIRLEARLWPNIGFTLWCIKTPKMCFAITLVKRDFFIFQQDSTPAHRARDSIELLWHETPDFIGPDVWPANSPDLSPVDYRIWGLIQERVYQIAIQDTDNLKMILPVSGLSWSKASMIKPLNSGGQGWELAFAKRDNTLNSC